METIEPEGRMCEEDKKGTKRGQKVDKEGTKSGQIGDKKRTEGGQKVDITTFAI